MESTDEKSRDRAYALDADMEYLQPLIRHVYLCHIAAYDRDRSVVVP